MVRNKKEVQPELGELRKEMELVLVKLVLFLVKVQGGYLKLELDSLVLQELKKIILFLQ